jgi:hypothetical protein
VLDGDEERAEQHRERGDGGVRPRVPPLRAPERVQFKNSISELKS